MLILNYLRYVAFLFVLIALFFIIDLGFLLFATWGIVNIINIFHWDWWKLILLGFLCILGIRILWRLMRYLVKMIIALASLISPYAALNALTITALSIINSILIICYIWSDTEVSIWIFNVFCTYLVLQLTWAFYIGGLYNITNTHDDPYLKH